MAELTVALEEGFENTHVIVTVNGAPALDDPTVTTRPQIGLARSFTVAVDDGPVTVDVSLPIDGVSEHIELIAPDATHVGISRSNGAITHRLSDQPFGYV